MRTIIKLMLVAAMLLLMGCGGGESATMTYGNTVTVTRVTPDRAVANQPTTFTVEVAYRMDADVNGIIELGFGTLPNLWATLSAPIDQTTVTKGTGTHTFTVTVTPPVTVDVNDPLHVIVGLSENPHSYVPRWPILDADVRPVIIE